MVLPGMRTHVRMLLEEAGTLCAETEDEEVCQLEKTINREWVSCREGGCDAARLGAFDYRKQQKQAKRSAREYISNYDALVAALAERATPKAENSRIQRP